MLVSCGELDFHLPSAEVGTWCLPPAASVLKPLRSSRGLNGGTNTSYFVGLGRHRLCLHFSLLVIAVSSW